MAKEEKAYILSLETSGATCGVALSDGSEVLAEYSIYISNQHDRLLADYTKRIMQDTIITIDDLSAVAVSAGPGSFTGLRIGAAFAKGLCYDGKPKFIAVPTLSAFAYHSAELANMTNSTRIIAAISSHKDLMYYQIFSNDIPAITKSGVGDGDQEVPALIKSGVGEGLHKIPPLTPLTDIIMTKSDDFLSIIQEDDLVCGSIKFEIKNAKHYSPEMKLTPSIIAEYAFLSYQQGCFEDPVSFKPLYVQEFVPRGYKQA